MIGIWSDILSAPLSLLHTYRPATKSSNFLLSPAPPFRVPTFPRTAPSPPTNCADRRYVGEKRSINEKGRLATAPPQLRQLQACCNCFLSARLSQKCNVQFIHCTRPSPCVHTCSLVSCCARVVLASGLVNHRVHLQTSSGYPPSGKPFSHLEFHHTTRVVYRERLRRRSCPHKNVRSDFMALATTGL